MACGIALWSMENYAKLMVDWRNKAAAEIARDPTECWHRAHCCKLHLRMRCAGYKIFLLISLLLQRTPSLAWEHFQGSFSLQRHRWHWELIRCMQRRRSLRTVKFIFVCANELNWLFFVMSFSPRPTCLSLAFEQIVEVRSLPGPAGLLLALVATEIQLSNLVVGIERCGSNG